MNPSPGIGAFRAAAGALLVGAACVLSSCVVEGRRPSQPLARPLPGTYGAPTAPGPAPQVPTGPVATPVPMNATSTAAVRFVMIPLGSVAYDGQVLPLVSPDGKFMAVEQGNAPSWPTLLAQDDAAPALGTRLAVYDLATPGMRAVPKDEPLPVGAVLGRACDPQGFLIEWPRPDGSRWIGRCAWVGAKVRWLVEDRNVNAHAVVSPSGGLAWTRRAIGEKQAGLVVRDSDGRVRTLETPDVSYAFPVYSSSGGILFVTAITADSLEFLALRLEHEGGARADALGPPIARRVLSKGGDMALAYQALAPSQQYPRLARAGVNDEDDNALPLLYHPVMARMCAFDWRNGAFLPLAPKSIAAAPSMISGSPGYFQTTPLGLVFTPPPTAEGELPPNAMARVMDTPFVPRATADPDRPLILLGPGKGSHLQVVAYAPPPPANPEPPRPEPGAPEVR